MLTDSWNFNNVCKALSCRNVWMSAFPHSSRCFQDDPREASLWMGSRLGSFLSIFRKQRSSSYILPLSTPWPQTAPCWFGQMCTEHLLTISLGEKKNTAWESLSPLISVRKAFSEGYFWPRDNNVKNHVVHHSSSPLLKYTIKIIIPTTFIAPQRPC